MNQKQKQDYPILIWVDSQILNEENKLYCEQLKNDYQNAFQAFNDISQACELLSNIGDQDVTILTSGQYAYQLVKHTKKNIIIFCRKKQTHFDLFTNNVQIKSIVSDSFQQAHKDAKMSMNQSDIQNEFIKLLSPLQRQARQYQHSKDHVSIQFLVVIEELQKNKKLKESDVFAEIENLLSIQKKQHLKLGIFKDLEIKEKEKEKETKQKFNLFEKLIYLYTREEISITLNQQFAEHNYQQITNIILCLYEGFKNHQNQNNKFQMLFRGVPFSEEEIEQIIRDLNQSKDQGTSLFWNTITSTSLSKDIAKVFCNTFYVIIYQIILNEEIPHPCFMLQQYNSKFPDEKEVILFPQFEFIVQEIQQQQIKNQQIYTVTIKQVRNNYAFALDPMMRKTYWDSVVEQKIKPKIDILVDFQFKRIFEFLTFCADEKQDQELYWRKFYSRIKNELENVFQQIQTQLTQIFNHSKYPDILSQIKNLTTTYIEVVKIEDQYQLALHQQKLLEEHIHEVMKSLKLNICTLVLKGIIDIKEKEYLQQLQQSFMKNQTTEILDCLSMKFINNQIHNQINNQIDNRISILQKSTYYSYSYSRYEMQSLRTTVPYVGIGLTALMTSISIGGVLLSDFLSVSEKIYNSVLAVIKTGGLVGFGLIGAEYGMSVGAPLGPIGIAIGGAIGGIFGGVTGNLFVRAVDDYTQFSLQVSFSSENKSNVKDGYLLNPGKRPLIQWQNVKDKVRSLILIGQTDTHFACLITNISRYKTSICPDEDVGIKFNQYQYKYIGPDDSSSKITFRLLATTQENINDHEVLQQLKMKQINIIDIAKREVDLRYI